MIVRRTAPCPRLARLVRFYQFRTADARAPSRRIALPARTDVLLEFYFTSPHLLELRATLTQERAPRVAAVGPQTFRRVDLLLSGPMDVFTVHFTPTGLHTLLGVPMAELTDAGIDAAALFGGRAIDDLHDSLAGASDFAARAQIADAFLLCRLASRSTGEASRAVTDALALMRRTPGSSSIRALAAATGFSDRQFRRLFEQQVGIAPKRYARIVRLEAAMAARSADPNGNWTQIAHDLGWFDQAHMDKDFLALAGTPPSRYPIAGRIG